MRPRDEVLRAHVREWIAKAEIDYRTAEWLLTSPEPIRESIGFHCQQAAEKYVKALLVSLEVDFPKTHDLEELLDLLSPVRPEFAVELDAIKILSPFGVRIRYPGDFPEVLQGQERMFFDLAAQVRKAILAQIGETAPGMSAS